MGDDFQPPAFLDEQSFKQVGGAGDPALGDRIAGDECENRIAAVSDNRSDGGADDGLVLGVEFVNLIVTATATGYVGIRAFIVKQKIVVGTAQNRIIFEFARNWVISITRGYGIVTSTHDKRVVAGQCTNRLG